MIDYSSYKAITKESSLAVSGSVYFCIPGSRYNGTEFIDEAVNNGATLCVGETDFDHALYVRVDDVISEFIYASQVINKFSETNMKYIAITGTDGKTSTSTLIHKLLNKLASSSYLGTSGLIINQEIQGYNGTTTPFSDMLYNYIYLADQKSDYFIMEASSHGLSQRRVGGLKFDAIGFTNLSPEHLDFHVDMDDYFNAKLKLFDYIKDHKTAVINIDDEYGKKIIELYPTCTTIGFNPKSDYQILNIEESIKGTKFTFKHSGKIYECKSSLLVEFNVYNLLMALVIVHNQGYELNDVIKLSCDLTIEGRMQLVHMKNRPTTILDFAHTPDSILKILKFVNKHIGDNKLFLINGCAGGRDKTKRTTIGNLMVEYATHPIITEDDPRDESVFEIAKMMLADNLEAENVIIIENRKDAIKYAYTNATKFDIILLLGKSGQTKMYYDGYTREYVELDEVLKYDLE